MKFKKYVLLFAFTLALICWVLLLPGLNSVARTPVRGIRVSLSQATSTVECSGTLEAGRQQVLNYGFAVIPNAVYVQVGDHVNAGEKLMDIDKTQTVEAFQNLTAAQQYNSYNTNSYDSDAYGSESDNEFASEYEQNAQSFSPSNETNIGKMLGQYTGNTTSLPGEDSAQDDSSDSSLSDTAAEVPSSVSDAESSVPDVAYSSISGIVTTVNVAKGEFTQAMTPLIVISDLSSVQVLAQVDQNMISKVRTGQTVTISGDALNKTYTGTVSKVYPSAHAVVSSSGTVNVVDVLINIANRSDELKPGLSVTADIVNSVNNRAVLLPYEAIQEDDANKEYVFVYKNGEAIRKDITTGQEYKDDVEVTGGISSNDIVIENPPSTLKSRDHVQMKSIGRSKA